MPIAKHPVQLSSTMAMSPWDIQHSTMTKKYDDFFVHCMLHRLGMSWSLHEMELSHERDVGNRQIPVSP